MDIKKVQKKHQNDFLKKANVVSVGYGYRYVNGERTDEICIVVGVTKKLPTTQIQTMDVVPQSIEGVIVDVIEVGHIVAQQINPRDKFRPAMPGTSIGHKNITAGTFGCIVEKGGVQMILSNNHVLANSNDAQLGDAIFQPGPVDGGTSADEIGVLEDFVPIIYGNSTVPPPPPVDPPKCSIAKGVAGAANLAAKTLGRKHRLAAFLPQAVTNRVDAAIARPTDGIVNQIVQIGTPTGTTDAELGMPVQKYGRTTLHATETIIQLNATVTVDYGTSGLAIFNSQIMTGSMSQGGDSGSAILDMSGRVVGLLFAGSDTVTIINPIQDVFNSLGVTLFI